MPQITDYSFLFQNSSLSTGLSGGFGKLSPIKISDLGSSEVRSQLKAAGIDTNSKRYKAVLKMLQEGEKQSPNSTTNLTCIKNLMRMYDKDGDLINSRGIAGMDATNIPMSQRHKIIEVSESSREEMFEETLRHFKQENGVANGDTTRRSEVYENYQRSVPKADRLKGSWTLEQYEKAYQSAMVDACKAANPKWELGMTIPKGALESVTRESVEATLVKGNGQYGETLTRRTVDVSL